MKKGLNQKGRCGLAVLLAGVMILTAGCAKTKPEETESNMSVTVDESDTEAGPPELEFPVFLADGALEISSVFQYTGANPDCQWQEGEDIGALVLVNRSEQYLAEADVTVTLSNEEILQFTVSDIPSGQTAWVFEPNNGAYPVSEYPVTVDGQAQFTDDKGYTSEQVSATAEGMVLDLNNTTDEDMHNLTVKCHILFSEVYFGGGTYSYPVETIPAGGNATVTATDCFLGDAAAVWIGPEE